MKMFNSDILFSGYYGQQNTGDDAFVEVSSWGAKKYWGKSNLRYLAIKKDLPEVKESIKGYPFTLPKTYTMQRNLLLKTAKIIVSAGGSTFHSIPPNSVKELTLKYKQHLKIGAIGVSIGPFSSKKNEKEIIEYIKQMDFLALRDKSSYEFANSLNLDYNPVEAFDLAALLPQIYLNTKTKNATTLKRIGVSVCNYERYIKGGNKENETRRNTFIIELLKQLKKNKQFIFRFFIFNGNQKIGDEGLTREIIRNLQLESDRFDIIPYDPVTERTWNLIQDCDTVISTRLHASIFACFAKVPFFLIEYHRKCADFLQDVGQEEKYRLFDAEMNVGTVVEQILSAANGDYDSPKYVNEMQRKAILNFTLTLK